MSGENFYQKLEFLDDGEVIDDGLIQNVEIVSGPEWLHYDPLTNSLFGTPSFENIGTGDGLFGSFNVRLNYEVDTGKYSALGAATNGALSYGTTDYTNTIFTSFSISDQNFAPNLDLLFPDQVRFFVDGWLVTEVPEVAFEPNFLADQGGVYSFQFKAFDYDAIADKWGSSYLPTETLDYVAWGLPSGLSLDSSGLLGGTLENEDVGVHQFTVQVTDKSGATDQKNI